MSRYGLSEFDWRIIEPAAQQAAGAYAVGTDTTALPDLRSGCFAAP